MTGNRFLRAERLAVAALCLTVCLTPMRGENALKTIENPGGGTIVYGPVSGQTTLQGAMVTMLRTVHTHYGERPEIGRFYQARGTNSVATFFALTSKSPAGKQIRGMVIVSIANPNTPAEAAVMYDDAAHFNKSWGPMMTKLTQAWHQDNPASARASASSSDTEPRAVPPLHRAGFPDGSGSIMLPDGWRITRSNYGSVWAEGPNGESVALAVIIHAFDPRSPMARQSMNQPGMVPAACCDLLQAWYAAAQRALPPGGSNPSIRLIHSGPMQGQPGALLATVEVDYHDGKGPINSRLQLAPMMPGLRPGTPNWAFSLFRLSAPARLAEREGPTLSAIGRSLNQNAGMIRAEGAREADQINRTAEQRRQIQNQVNQSNYQHTRDVEAAGNEQAKRNQAFDNYLLDRSVIQYNGEGGGHATVGYATANWLVTQFPNQFQYVPTQDFVKPTDY